MKIKKFKEFKIFEISGTELVGPMGPNYGDTTLPRTVPSIDTDVLYSDIADKIFTYDDYQTLYQKYLSLGGKPLNGFTKDNLEKVVDKTMSKKSIMESGDFDTFNFDKNYKDKKKIIAEISNECLRDFCYINSLDYKIEYGKYYYKNRKRNANSRGMEDKYIPDSLEIRSRRLLGNKISHRYKSHKCASILIRSKYLTSSNNSFGYAISHFQRICNDNNIELKNAISHLKNSLEKELDIVDFKSEKLIQDYQMFIQIFYE